MNDIIIIPSQMIGFNKNLKFIMTHKLEKKSSNRFDFSLNAM